MKIMMDIAMGLSFIQCDRPSGCKLSSELTAVNGDCDDENPAFNPGIPGTCSSSTTNDCGSKCIFRSAANGDFSSLTTWQVKNSAGNFVKARRAPKPEDSTIFIYHEVTINIYNYTQDELIIVPSGHLIVSDKILTLSLNNSADPEIDVQGKLSVINGGRIAGTGNIHIYGEAINNSLIKVPAYFKGTSSQNLVGTGSWDAVILDNPAGLIVPSGNQRVGDFTFSQGKVHSNPGASITVNKISGYGNEKFFEGKLIVEYKYQSEDGDPPDVPVIFRFPVGLNGVYLPMTLDAISSVRIQEAARKHRPLESKSLKALLRLIRFHWVPIRFLKQGI
jgi:hypothetical protein